MCPACFANIALLLTGAISTGGVAAAAIKLFRNKKIAAKSHEGSMQRREGNEHH